MPLTHAIRGTLAWNPCTAHLTRSFTAAAGVSITLADRSRPWQSLQTPPRASAFSSRADSLPGHELDITQDLPSELNEPKEASIQPNSEHPPVAAQPPPPQQNAVPWYLQVDTPTPQQDHPLSARQQLPELPPSPPPLLQPILEHVSVELGLDDLSLLDLRALDPPPALGANLIMVIGTARSEKHLHVAADRLARWLRSTYKLSPIADGLLGRNELKLKLRRKAKRSRLLSAVGAKETSSGDVDDGIRTGWVCVNVGRVEGGDLKKETDLEIEGEQDFVGFGTRTGGSRIVVQMLTEEKRGQIDLETLWNGILRRSLKAQQIEPDEAEIPQPEAPKKTLERPKMPQAEEPRMFESPSIQGGPRMPSTSGSSHFMPFNGPSQQGAQQSRGFSTFTDIGTEPFSKSYKRKFRARELERNTEQQLQQADLSATTLRKLLDVLKSMDPDSAFDALGKDREDTTSTDFLVAFHQAMPDFPRARHWHLHTELSCFGLELGHPGYTPELLVSHIESMHHACITPSRATYHMILETLLPPSGLLYQEDTGGDPSYRLHTDAVKIVMDILDNMYNDGFYAGSRYILHLLSQATVLPADLASTDASPQPSLEVPSHPLDLTIPILRYNISQSHWPHIWRIWTSFPRRFLPRPKIMYRVLFDAVAATRHQNACIETLRALVPDLLREEYREDYRDEESEIRLRGELAKSVLRCLQVAEPRAAEMGRKGGRGEWAELWRAMTRTVAEVGTVDGNVHGNGDGGEKREEEGVD